MTFGSQGYGYIKSNPVAYAYNPKEREREAFWGVMVDMGIIGAACGMLFILAAWAGPVLQAYLNGGL